MAPGAVLGLKFATCTNRTCVFPSLEAGSRALQALFDGRCSPTPKGRDTGVVQP